MRACRQVHLSAQVVETVGCWKNIVLASLRDLAVNPVVVDRCNHLVVDLKLAVAAEKLKMQAVVSGFGRGQGSVPNDALARGQCGMRLVGKVDRRIDVDHELPESAALEPRLAVVREVFRRHRCAIHVVGGGVGHVRAGAGELTQCGERRHLPLWQPHCLFSSQADGHKLTGAGTNQRNTTKQLRLERKNRIIVLEKYRCIGGRSANRGLVCSQFGRRGLSRFLAVEHAELVHLVEHAASGMIDGALRNHALVNQMLQVGCDFWLIHSVPRPGCRLFGQTTVSQRAAASAAVRFILARRIVDEERGSGPRNRQRARHLQIEPGVDEVCAVIRAPVGGDKAFESQLAFQNSIERIVVTAGVFPVDLGVRAHDGRDAGVDRIDKRRNIDLVQRLQIGLHKRRVGIVGNVVLGLRHDSLLLHAGDKVGADKTGQQRIFAVGVVTAAPAKIAIHINEGLQHDVDSAIAGLIGHRFAVGARILHAESCRQPHG